MPAILTDRVAGLTEVAEGADTHVGASTVGASTDDETFASHARQLGAERSAASIGDLPPEILQLTMRGMPSQDALRFGQTSHAVRAAAQGDKVLQRTLAQAQTANKQVGALRSRGLLDPEHPAFAGTHRLLGPHLQHLDEGWIDALIQGTVNIRDESFRSNALAAASTNWEQLSRSQQDTLLSGAAGIANAPQRAEALSFFGSRNLRRLSTTQQNTWVNAVSELPAEQRLFVVTQSDVGALDDAARQQLRQSVNSLPASFGKEYALRRFE